MKKEMEIFQRILIAIRKEQKEKGDEAYENKNSECSKKTDEQSALYCSGSVTDGNAPECTGDGGRLKDGGGEIWNDTDTE